MEPELTVFRKLYNDVQVSILNPVRVASLLRQEGVVADDLLDEVSDMNRFTQAEKTASIMRHVEGAIRVNPRNFWAFVAVLEKSGPPACHVAKRMRDNVDLHTPGDIFVSETYREDFDNIIKGEFIALHRDISKHLSNNDDVSLNELKEFLVSYSELEGPLQAADTISSVMRVIQRHSSVINCFYLKCIAREFDLPEVTEKIEAYCKQVDEFCHQTISKHSYVTSFMAEPQNHILSTQKLTLKLEWKPDDKTLADIQSLIRKTFKSLSDHVHVVVVKEGSVTVICYAPHYIMGSLVQMAKESKRMLLENSVSYLSIGYTVVLDSSTDQETKICDLTQENTALQLRLTALQELCQKLGSLSLPKETKQQVLSDKPFYSKSEETVSRLTELSKFTNVESTVSSDSPPLHKTSLPLSDKPTLYQSKSDEMMSMLMKTEPESTTLSVLQSTEKLKRLQERERMEMEEEMKMEQYRLSQSRVTLIGLTPDGIKYLMEHQMVENIDLLEMVTLAQWEAIFQGLKRNTTLRTLDVPYTSNISTLCASLSVNNTLQDLALRHVDDHAMELLSAALSINRSLHRLTLSGCTDTGAQHLSTMLIANTTLQELYLSYTEISDTGILHLSEALKHNNSLTCLDLSDSEHITNTGAVALSKMLLINKSLERLDLEDTSVGKEGAAALMESLLHNQVLTRLTLPDELGTYLRKHALYDRVKNTLW